jgi:hypothetical protein
MSYFANLVEGVFNRKRDRMERAEAVKKRKKGYIKGAAIGAAIGAEKPMVKHMVERMFKSKPTPMGKSLVKRAAIGAGAGLAVHAVANKIKKTDKYKKVKVKSIDKGIAKLNKERRSINY